MAAEKYRLMPNEAIILKNDRVSRMQGLNAQCELVLTNLNLFLVIGTFKKKVIQYPLSQIKVYDGRANALLSGQFGNSVLEVYFIDGGKESFRFTAGKKEILKWISAINRATTGNDSEADTTGGRFFAALPGTEMIADAMEDTIGAFKDALGIKSKKAFGASTEKVARKCSSCGAPISGGKGQVIHCRYCDSDQQL